MASEYVGDQVLQQIPVGTRDPEVVVRIDDELRGVENVLLSFDQPIRPHARVMKREAFGRGAHGVSPGLSFGCHPATGSPGVQRSGGFRQWGRCHDPRRGQQRVPQQ